MGLPILQDQITLCDATKFVDIFDLTAAKYINRVFTAIAVQNGSQATTIELAFGVGMANVRQLVVGLSQFFVLDALMFGPNIYDDSTLLNTTKIRARLGTTQGTQASGTITYSGVGNPTDGQSVNVNGQVYEFSNDQSPEIPGSVIVNIAGTKDLTYTALLTAILATDQALQNSAINTGTHILTIQSVAGGSPANAITIADGASPTGATFSGATLSGAVGGYAPVFHIW
jgi:hypothetical protein